MLWAKLKPSSSSSSTFPELLLHTNSASGDEAADEQLPMAPQRLTKTQSSMNVVNEEYIKALHTKSYVDMYSRVHHQLDGSSTTPKKEEENKEKSQHTLRSPLSNCHSEDQIPNFLPEQRQDCPFPATSRNSTSSRFIRHLNNLLLDFFDTTFQASTACASVLSSIDRARSHHRSIHRLLVILSSTPSTSSPSAFSDLCSHLELDNPLSVENLTHFHLIHSRYPTLIRRLTSAHRKISRHLKLVKFTKKASGVAIVALIGAVVVAAVVVATHGAVSVAAAPVVAVCSTGLRWPSRWFTGWMGLERAKARVDAATKGAYIIERDLDTMSQMLRRVHDEVEHGRDVARMVVRNREWEMVREVVKEMEGRRGEVGFGLEEQLQELEEHVYLCLITINRSRRLVSEEMMELREAPPRVSS